MKLILNIIALLIFFSAQSNTFGIADSIWDAANIESKNYIQKYYPQFISTQDLNYLDSIIIKVSQVEVWDGFNEVRKNKAYKKIHDKKYYTKQDSVYWSHIGKYYWFKSIGASKIGQLDLQYYFLKKAVKNFKSIGASCYESLMLVHLYKVFLFKGKRDIGLRILHKAEETCKGCIDNSIQTQVNYSLAEHYFGTTELDKSIIYLKAALELSSKSGDINHIYNCKMLLIKALMSMNNYKNALTHLYSIKDVAKKFILQERSL